MGFPMRYPRSLIVWFVALGLVAVPAISVRAEAGPPVSEELAHVDTMSAVADRTAAAADLARVGGVVNVLADEADLDYNEAIRQLAAFSEMLLAVADAGERTGVLVVPEVGLLIDVILRAAATVDPDAAQALAKATYLSERSAEASDLIGEAERRVVNALASPTEGTESLTEGTESLTEGTESPTERTEEDAVERWRPLVEEYFAPELVDQALAIIACESEGDPSARNPRSSATGLFQFISRTWANASEAAGFAGSSALDPKANVAAAAWLVDYSLESGQSAWEHWTCRP